MTAEAQAEPRGERVVAVGCLITGVTPLLGSPLQTWVRGQQAEQGERWHVNMRVLHCCICHRPHLLLQTIIKQTSLLACMEQNTAEQRRELDVSLYLASPWSGSFLHNLPQ